jgi:vancomycin resistance protein YoaR
MTDDIVERLDEAYESLCDIGGAWERDVVADAKVEIERLQGEMRQLKAELFAERNNAFFHQYGDGSWRLVGDDGLTLDWSNGPLDDAAIDVDIELRHERQQ